MEERDLDRVLAQCLDTLQDGEDTLEGCLARYPSLAGELAPLLRTTAALRALPPIQPSPTFRAVAKTRLLNLLASRRSERTATASAAPAHLWKSWLRHSWTRHAWAWRLASLLLVVSLLGTGTVLAAAESMPDNPLYPVKLATESVLLSLTRAEEKRFDLYLQQANRRLIEATAMALALKPVRTAQSLDAYDAILLDMQKVTTLAANRGKDVAPLVQEFQDHINRQQIVLQRVYDNASPRRRPALGRLLAAVTDSQRETLAALQKVVR
jgi:hypothetical protein